MLFRSGVFSIVAKVNELLKKKLPPEYGMAKEAQSKILQQRQAILKALKEEDNALDKRQSLLGFQLVSIDTTIKHKTYRLKMHQDGHGEWIEEKGGE